MKKNTAIKLTGVSKTYELHHERPTLVEKFVNGRNETFWALKNINVSIYKGERVGIIGPNGSGKTSLLKIIVGITSPSRGVVTTHGKIVSLIDLMAGFHPDLAGYDNIFLNGMLLGMDKQEITKKLDKIIAFADIKQFIDSPLFTYSSGMALRLGFAIAVHANPDILLLDENMSTGDKAFQKKSQAKLRTFFKKGKTILIASHNMNFINQNCHRILLMTKGKLAGDGNRRMFHKYLKT